MIQFYCLSKSKFTKHIQYILSTTFDSRIFIRICLCQVYISLILNQTLYKVPKSAVPSYYFNFVINRLVPFLISYTLYYVPSSLYLRKKITNNCQRNAIYASSLKLLSLMDMWSWAPFPGLQRALVNHLSRLFVILISSNFCSCARCC